MKQAEEDRAHLAALRQLRDMLRVKDPAPSNKGDWWCCSADYPNHTDDCPRREVSIGQGC